MSLAPHPNGLPLSTVRRLRAAIDQLVVAASGTEQCLANEIGQAASRYRASARNLAHYLALRQHDLRSLQSELAACGLSSLGRCEPHTLASLTSVEKVLAALAGDGPLRLGRAHPPVDFGAGPAALERHTRALLGPRPARRSTRIMVTMPSEAARDPALVRKLLESGMDVMRINCAHDDAAAWRAMVRHLHTAMRATKRRCRVLVDLAGPKLRTGALPLEEAVLKIKARRDERGELLQPARLWLTPARRPEPAPPGVTSLPVVGPALSPLRRVENLQLEDARGRRRRLHVVAVEGRSVLCEARRTVYVRSGAKLSAGRSWRGRVADLPPVPLRLRLGRGDRLVLTRDPAPGAAARGTSGTPEFAPARIPCTLPEAFRDVRAGEPIWIDDGKIGGVVMANDGARMEVELRQVPESGGVVRPDQGINFPGSELRLGGLTAKDRDDLAFALVHADLVGLSFAQRPEQVHELQQEIARRGRTRIGIILKVETRSGFEALPRLLLAGLRAPPVGVMVARGDLAVELGFERLAEVQEEILWFCEAAHVPVVWATQVLETMSKRGAPSRAEVTDAAMSVRAECVMLNKGPFVDRAVCFLDDVLARMGAHQKKKRAMLRRLSVAGETPAPLGSDGDGRSQGAGLGRAARRRMMMVWAGSSRTV
jgi:pyruvate kinase